MSDECRNVAMEKIKEMPVERVMKLLIFMAGMEAERAVKEKQTAGPEAFLQAGMNGRKNGISGIEI